jgi:polar amino acid transport system substrate-binding protein
MRASRLVIALVAGASAAGAAACGGEGQGGRSTLDEVRARETVRIGIRADNPPHSSIGPGGRLEGFDVDIARAVARHLGARPQIVRVDELTRLTYLKGRKIDMAVASINHTLERDREVDFSKTYFFSHQSFLVREGAVTRLRQLRGRRVGASRGSSAIGNYRGYLRRAGYRGDPMIVEFGDKQAAVRAVRSGAIAGYTEDSEVLAAFARRNPGLTVLLDERIAPKHDGIAVRQDDSRFLDAVNVALQRVATSGEYDRIYARWFGPGSEVPFPRLGSIELWPDG